MSQIVFHVKSNQFCEVFEIEKRKEIIRKALSAFDIDRPLRVLVATNSLGCGGQEHQVMRLIPELKKLGIEAEHMYYSSPHALFEKYQNRNIKSTFFDKKELGKLKCLRKQVAHMKSQRFDIVLAFGGTANIYVRAAALFAGTKLILASSRDRTGYRTFTSVLINSMLNIFTPAWIINSSTNADGLKKLKFMKNKPLYVLPNALDGLDEPQPAEIDVSLKNWINGRQVVAAVGRICGVKNYDLFLDSAKQVHQSVPDSCFLIIGDPDCSEEGQNFKKHLSERIKDEKLGSFIKMTGRIENMAGFYPHIDLLASTSKYEGCPNVVLEAMRASKPIVMTNSCDTSLMIKQGQNGFVVDVDDANVLAEKIIMLMRCRKTREDFGRVSRNIVKAFSAPESAWALAKIYMNELGKKKCGK